MVTQNKTWRFSKEIKNDNYNVWRKSTLQLFDLGAVISSLLRSKCGGGVFRSDDITAPRSKAPSMID